MATKLWGVYIRSFDGYENVWRFLTGPFKTKKLAEHARAIAIADRHGVCETSVKKI